MTLPQLIEQSEKELDKEFYEEFPLECFVNESETQRQRVREFFKSFLAEQQTKAWEGAVEIQRDIQD